MEQSEIAWRGVRGVSEVAVGGEQAGVVRGVGVVVVVVVVVVSVSRAKSVRIASRLKRPPCPHRHLLWYPFYPKTMLTLLTYPSYILHLF
jgi:hypothetical protein